MTEEEIDKVEAQIAIKARKREEEALAKFAKGPIPKLDWQMDRILEDVLSRIASIRAGVAPEAFGSYTRDELARVLSTATYCRYGTWHIMRERALEEPADADIENYAQTRVARCWTPQFGHWRQIVTALGEYLYEAAVFAKSLNPASTAARLYLRAWHIIEILSNRNNGYSEATANEALAIVRLERVAVERLWVDAAFAALPPFKKAE